MKQPAWGITVVFAAQGLGLGADPPRYEDHNNLLYYLDEQDSKQPVRSKAEWDKRRQHIVANLELVMGPLPRAEKAPLEIQVLQERRLDGYTRKKITYEALAGDPVPAYLMAPDSPGRRSAVLALHPTWALGKGIPAGIGGGPHRWYAHVRA